MTPRLADREITLDVSRPAKAWLAARGYDPTYGARPLKRLIQRGLLNPLATKILAGDVPRGGTVSVELEGEVDDDSSTLRLRSA